MLFSIVVSTVSNKINRKHKTVFLLNKLITNISSIITVRTELIFILKNLLKKNGTLQFWILLKILKVFPMYQQLQEITLIIMKNKNLIWIQLRIKTA